MPTRRPELTYTTPLPQKLGIVSHKGEAVSTALLAESPEFRNLLGDLPPVLDLLSAQLPASAHTWIIYPKGRLKPGFNEHHVRNTGLAAGFVDYKVCSVSDAWSALKFARRKSPIN